MIKVSVIIPIYNAEKYLDKCLKSLVSQSLKEIEIIAINDGSTDNSLQIIKKYHKKYPSKIIIIDNQNNGIGKTRNIGIEIARGEYITFIDSDDYVTLNMLERCYLHAINNNLELVVCNYYEINESDNSVKEILLKHFQVNNLSENRNLLFEINSAPWNKLYKRSLFDNEKIRFPEKIKYEDLGLIPIILNEAKGIGSINVFGNYYLIRSKSETTTIDKRIYDIFKILDIVNSYYKKNSYFNDELEFLNISKIFVYTISQRNISNKKAREDFIDEAFKYLNTNFPNWRNNKYYKNRSFFKKIIESHKVITKIYCQIKNKITN